MSIRILVAGGRDISGDQSFVQTMSERLDEMGIGAEAKVLEYLSPGHLDPLVDAIRSIRPDITVLHLGSSQRVTLLEHLRRKLGLKGKENSKGAAPNATFRPTSIWRIASSARVLANALIGRDAVNLRLDEVKFTKLFETIAVEDAGDVIVLGPLPCADPVLIRYRVRLKAILQDLSRAHGFVFLRSPLGQENHQPYFADDSHLNALGQEVVGQSVATVISIVCRSVEVDAPPKIAAFGAIRGTVG